MINKHFLLLFSVIILFACLSKAQVKTKNFARGIPDNLIPVKEMTGKEYKILPLAEFNNLKQLANKNMSLADRSRFALSTPVNIDILKEAALIKTGTTATYYFTFKAIDALNLSIQFNKFILSENSLLSIYNKTELTDSITAQENNENNTWATRVYQGNALHIVLKIPLEEFGQTILKMGFVNFGYKKTGFTPHFGSPGASDQCQVNVACPAGNGWNNERNSVALINANGHWATGALVMNTCGTNRPYLLTANHNLSVGNVPNWVFQFLYYSTDCNTDIGYREDIQIYGCTVRASNGASDFTLLELNQPPPANSGVHYAGWSRDSNPFSITSTTFLHHPKGDVMKISVDNGSPVQALAGAIQCWRLDLNLGGDQPGSSGGPYFNQQHRIIGQHYGVPTVHEDEPCHPEKYGGRFDLSWTGGGTNTTRLSNWLDPINTGAGSMNTTNISALPKYQQVLSISGSSSLCSGTGLYTLNGQNPGAVISWVSSDPNIATITPSGNPATVTRLTSGTVTITANVNATNCTLAGSAQFVIPGVYNGGGGDFTISGPSTACPNSYVGYQTTALPGATNYTWILPNGWTIVAGQGTPYLSATTSGKVNGTVRLKVSNACGSGAPELMYVSLEAWCSGQFLLSPNPATNTVTIQKNEKPEKATGQPDAIITEIRIFDNIGNLKKQIKYGAGIIQAQVNVADLKTGIYFVEISSGQTKERQQLLIQK